MLFPALPAKKPAKHTLQALAPAMHTGSSTAYISYSKRSIQININIPFNSQSFFKGSYQFIITQFHTSKYSSSQQFL
jgi:hypothetical protein